MLWGLFCWLDTSMCSTYISTESQSHQSNIGSLHWCSVITPFTVQFTSRHVMLSGRPYNDRFRENPTIIWYDIWSVLVLLVLLVPAAVWRKPPPLLRGSAVATGGSSLCATMFRWAVCVKVTYTWMPAPKRWCQIFPWINQFYYGAVWVSFEFLNSK